MMSTCMPQGAQQSVPIGRYKLRVEHVAIIRNHSQSFAISRNQSQSGRYKLRVEHVVSVVAAPARHLWGTRRDERRCEHLHANGHVDGEVSSPMGEQGRRAPW